MPRKSSFERNSTLTILLFSLGFISLHFFSTFVSASMVAMKERRRILLLLLGLYTFLYMHVKHVVDIQSIAFARQTGEVCNIELDFLRVHMESRINARISRLLVVAFVDGKRV
jgi:hypothetical protein